ncbi:hypothetical protein PT2222_290099 [Paraburkholderia tropica]
MNLSIAAGERRNAFLPGFSGKTRDYAGMQRGLEQRIDAPVSTDELASL